MFDASDSSFVQISQVQSAVASSGTPTQPDTQRSAGYRCENHKLTGMNGEVTFCTLHHLALQSDTLAKRAHQPRCGCSTVYHLLLLRRRSNKRATLSFPLSGTCLRECIILSSPLCSFSARLWYWYSGGYIASFCGYLSLLFCPFLYSCVIPL